MWHHPELAAKCPFIQCRIHQSAILFEELSDFLSNFFCIDFIIMYRVSAVVYEQSFYITIYIQANCSSRYFFCRPLCGITAITDLLPEAAGVLRGFLSSFYHQIGSDMVKRKACLLTKHSFKCTPSNLDIYFVSCSWFRMNQYPNLCTANMYVFFYFA